MLLSSPFVLRIKKGNKITVVVVVEVVEVVLQGFEARKTEMNVSAVIWQ